MQNTLHSMESQGHISPERADTARFFERIGTRDHGIGAELEVTSSAARFMPRVSLRGKDAAKECQDALESTGFTVGPDACYEIQTPPARHPAALAIACSGLIPMGWLPERTPGKINAHISISSPHLTGHPMLHLPRLIDLLRAVDLSGHTTPERLMSPLVTLSDDNADAPRMDTWACKGVGGVRLHRPKAMPVTPIPGDLSPDITRWRGKNLRAEFRTPIYRGLGQFSSALTSTYYLTRGLLAPEQTPASDVYRSYEQWLLDYFESNRLPTSFSLCIEDHPSGPALREYIEPYADHLDNNERSVTVVRELTEQAVNAIREELKMPQFNI